MITNFVNVDMANTVIITANFLYQLGTLVSYENKDCIALLLIYKYSSDFTITFWRITNVSDEWSLFFLQINQPDVSTFLTSHTQILYVFNKKAQNSNPVIT